MATSDGFTKLSADSYRLSRVDGGGRYPDAAAMKAAVVADADAFAAARGKVAAPISTHEETMRVGHLSTIDYEFRLVAPGTVVNAAVPAAAAAPVTADTSDRGAAASPASGPLGTDAVASPSARPSPPPAAPAAAPAGRPDLYTELRTLEDLRSRGILSEEEFEALKAKLLVGR